MDLADPALADGATWRRVFNEAYYAKTWSECADLLVLWNSGRPDGAKAHEGLAARVFAAADAEVCARLWNAWSPPLSAEILSRKCARLMAEGGIDAALGLLRAVDRATLPEVLRAATDLACGRPALQTGSPFDWKVLIAVISNQISAGDLAAAARGLLLLRACSDRGRITGLGALVQEALASEDRDLQEAAVPLAGKQHVARLTTIAKALAGVDPLGVALLQILAERDHGRDNRSLQPKNRPEGCSANDPISYKLNLERSLSSGRLKADGCMPIVLQIFGAIKTGTSSIVGLLNCHPRALILYEIGLASDEPSKHGGLLLQRHPQLRALQRSIAPASMPYLDLAAQLEAFGFDDRPSVIGDKYPGFQAIRNYDLSADRVIFCVRDLRTWLAKDAVRQTFGCEQNVVPVATAYCRAFIKSFFWPNVMHVRLEEFVKKNRVIERNILNFLSLSSEEMPVDWWNTVGIHSDRSLKSSTRWWTGHPSSMLKPEKSDTIVTVRKNAFWAEIDSIMKKYYEAASVANNERLMSRTIANNDVDQLFKLNTRFELSIQQCYLKIATETFGLKERAQLAKRSAHVSTKEPDTAVDVKVGLVTRNRG